MLKIVGLAIVSVFAFVLLRKDRAEFSFVIQLCAVVLLFIYVLPVFQQISDKLNGFIRLASLDAVYLEIPIRCLGISWIGKLMSEICKDAGQNAMSFKVELAARILILFSAVPIAEDLLMLIIELVEKLG